jgi:hypothetical protein
MEPLGGTGEKRIVATQQTPNAVLTESEELSKEANVRKHNMVGLFSIPGKGLGYGGNRMSLRMKPTYEDGKDPSITIASAARPARKVIGHLKIFCWAKQ